MGHHVSIKRLERGKFHIVFARHFFYHGAFSVHHLIVRDGKNKVFGKRIEEREGETIMIVLSEKRIKRHIAEHIVHPAHIPLEVKAQSTRVRRLCYQRPRRGFLGDHHD